MATTSLETDRWMDQLQHEFNLVLEQTGRVFAAANTTDGPIVAQTTRLKQNFPVCLNKFHHALDRLEDELLLTQTVLRRDLAVLRMADISPEPPRTSTGNASQAEVTMTDADQQQSISNDMTMQDAPASTEGIQIEGASDAREIQSTDAKTNDPSGKDLDPSPAKNASSSSPTADTTKPDQPMETNPSEPSNPMQNHTTMTSTADNDHPDPNPDSAADANSADADLDSLFGGSIDAIGNDVDADADVETEANADDSNKNKTNDPVDANNENSLDGFALHNGDTMIGGDGVGANVEAEFDFESFTKDSDNISALLPGLQDYANADPSDAMVVGSGDPEYDAIFGPDTAVLDQGPSQQNGNGAQEAPEGGESFDMTFEDFINSYDGGSLDAGDGDETFDFGYNQT